MAAVFRITSIGLWAVCLLMLASPGRALPPNHWYPRFPKPAKLYRTQNQAQLGGIQGADFYMLHSLAGLAAKSVREGSGDAMLWLDYNGADSYSPALLTDYLAASGAADQGVKTAWQLVDLFKQAGLVSGYIIYNFETGTRGIYADGALDESVNVATSMASILNAIIIQPGQVATAQAHGLTQLLDARGQTEQWVWQNYGTQFNQMAVLVQDPKLPNLRELAIGLKVFCLFGVDALASTVYAAMPANTPILGWNQGDEYVQTALATQWGHWNDANNLSNNLPVLSSLVPDADLPVGDLDLNARSRVDVTRLVWETDVHYTAMILSDGDSFNLNVYFLNDPERMFYQHRNRGQFPFGWGTASASLYQLAPSVLRLLGQQATANDSHLLVGGGYYYPERYGSSRADAPLTAHLDDIAAYMSAMNQRMFWSVYAPGNWNSAQAATARTAVAQHLPFLDGAFAIDYTQYSLGQGQIFWNDNGSGVEIPTLMARHSIWNNVADAGDGTPLEVADSVNNSAHTGAPNDATYFDWILVHAWSFFQNGQDIPQTGVSADIAAGIERAYGSASWCAARLADHVRLVKPDELLWYTRLHLRTSQTFNLFLNDAQHDLDAAAFPSAARQQLQARLDGLRTRYAALNYGKEAEKRDFLEQLQALRRTILNGADQSQTFGFEPSEGYQPGPLPQVDWNSLAGSPAITTTTVHSGLQALTLSSDAIARGWFTWELSDSFWVDGYLRAASYPSFDNQLPSQTLGPVLRFSGDQGLMALDGNGSGGGTWISLGALTPNAWQRITLHIDHAAHRWSVYLNFVLLRRNLGFKDDAAGELKGLKCSGASVLDDFSISASAPPGLLPANQVDAQYWTLY
jgi:hypothetical protein